MRVTLPAILALAMVAGCKEDGSSGSTATPFSDNSPVIYESGDLGQLLVLGANVEAKARFTFNADEFPVAVHLEAEYVPSGGNTMGATCELSLYDTKADGDATNDVLIGQLTPAMPWSRGRLDAVDPGSFSIQCPIGAGTGEKIGPKVETLGIRVRVNTTAWYGTVTNFKVKIITLRNVAMRSVPLSFVRDQ